MIKNEKERLRLLIELVKNCREESGDLNLKFAYYFLDMALVELKDMESQKGWSDEKRSRKKPL